MRYAVVVFKDSQLTNEVPETWIWKTGDKFACWWPKDYSRTPYLLKNPSTLPITADNFELFDIDPPKYYDTRDKARKRAANETYTSDEAKLGKGLRVKKKKRISSSDSESDATEKEDSQQNVPYDYSLNAVSQSRAENSPHISKHSAVATGKISDVEEQVDEHVYSELKARMKTPKTISKLRVVDDIDRNSGKNEDDFIDSTEEPEKQINSEQIKLRHTTEEQSRPRIIEDIIVKSARHADINKYVQDNVEDEDFSSTMTINCNSSLPQNNLIPKNAGIKQPDLQTGMLKQCSKMGIQLKSLANRMDKMERNERARRNAEIVPNYIPFKDVVQMFEFEKELQTNQQAQTELENKIIKTGGCDSTMHIQSVLREIFSHECAAACSWKGLGPNNTKVGDLLTMIAIRETLCRHYELLTEFEFNTVAKTWFHYAKQRLRRKKEIEAGFTKPASSKVKTPKLKQLIIPKSAIFRFLHLAKGNSQSAIETCAYLCGKDEEVSSTVTHLVLPEQEGTMNTCTATNEVEVSEVLMQQELVILGWIHTHPTHSCFPSSIDLHTQLGYQKLRPEAVAVVCSLKDNETNFFNVTTSGLQVLQNCNLEGFHAHPSASPLFQQAEHVVVNDLTVEVIDLR